MEGLRTSEGLQVQHTQIQHTQNVDTTTFMSTDSFVSLMGLDIKGIRETILDRKRTPAEQAALDEFNKLMGYK